MATTQRKQTAQHGNWAVTVSLPLPEEQAQNAVLFGERAGLPIVRLEDTVTHEGLGFRPTKQRRHKVRTARSVALSDGTIVNHENCIKLFEALLPHLPSASPTTTQSSGESGSVEGQRELTDKEKDVKKCVLVLATHMAHILGNKTLRREAMAALSKPLMVELTKCDWLVLNREEDWYKFVKGWAKMRVKKELGIPDEPKESPKPACDDKEVKDKAAKGEKQEGDNKDDKDQDKGKEKKKDEADDADGSDSEVDEVDEEKKREEEKQWKAERKRLRRKWKKKDKPAYTKTPEYRKSMNEQLKGIIEHVRFAKMSLNNLAYLNREPFDIPVPVLAEAYKAHLFIDDKPFQKRLAAKGVGAVRNRRYKVLEWDINRMSSGLILSDDRMTVKANSNCSPKTIFAKAGYSSGRHKWEIVTPSDPGCSSAVGVAVKGTGLGTLLGMDSSSWAIRLDPQSYCSTGERRKNAEGKVKAGDVVSVELDMDKGVVTFSINNKVQARWKGLEGKTIYPALNLCHQDNQHSKGFLLRRA